MALSRVNVEASEDCTNILNIAPTLFANGTGIEAEGQTRIELNLTPKHNVWALVEPRKIVMP